MNRREGKREKVESGREEYREEIEID